MEDINLDFLNSPTKCSRPKRYPSPCVYNSIDVGFGKRKHGNKKKLEMAQSIAKVDELLREIDRLKNQNNEFQSQLKDFQRTAQEIQILYNKEKQEHEAIKESYINLKTDYEKVDSDLINKTMVNDQMKARLAEYDTRPINFNALVVKYIKLMNKLEGDDILKHSSDKDLLERLKDYCCNMKLKIPSNNSPKKSKVKSCKIKTVEAFVQCDLYEKSTGIQNLPDKKREISPVSSAIQCNLLEENVVAKVVTKDQATQCFTAKRDQASQYISTMITRQTNTEKVIQKHVQTMYTEPQTIPTVDDILSTFSKWAHIRSVSPLLESPQYSSNQQQVKSFNTLGTCTMLCNIRRKIDYLPPNISNIKQEIITPSASPTPNTQRVTMNRQCNTALPNVSVNTSNQNQHHSISHFLNIAANTSSLVEFTSNTFNELWQLFGKILLNLLQVGNAGIANSHLNSTINQQQFLDWLLGLYVSSQPQTMTSAETQTEEESVPLNTSSPVSFDSSSVLLTRNIVRPQARKTSLTTPISRESEAIINSEFQQDNNFSCSVNESNYADSVLNRQFSPDHNTTDMEIQQINIFSNSTKTSTEHKEISSELKFNSTSCAKKNLKKSKHYILEKIPAVIPGNKLSKKQRKALKRLLKSNNHRKKLLKTKNSPNKGDIVEFPSKISNDSNEHIETAVDFLKMFATTEENLDCTKNENLIEQCLSETSEPLKVVDTEEDFNFIKPSYTGPKRNKKSTTSGKDTFIKPTTKCKTPKCSKNIENKYIFLFGDSDSETDELESEYEEQNKKPVIESIINLSKYTSLEHKNDIKSYLETSKKLQEQNLNNYSSPKYGEDCLNSVTVNHQSQTYGKFSQVDTTCKENSVHESSFNSHRISNSESNPTDAELIKSTTQNNEALTINPVNDDSKLPSLDYRIEDKEAENNFDLNDTNAIYTRDFEKDFELSSDDESLPCNNEPVYSPVENLPTDINTESKDNVPPENKDTKTQDKELFTDNENYTCVSESRQNSATKTDFVEEVVENVDNKSDEEHIHLNISPELENSKEFVLSEKEDICKGSTENKPTDMRIIKSTIQQNVVLTVNPVNDSSKLPSLEDKIEDEEFENNFNTNDTNAIYISDFEKDFELSSDDETLSCSNEPVYSTVEYLSEDINNEPEDNVSPEKQETKTQDVKLFMDNENDTCVSEYTLNSAIKTDSVKECVKNAVEEQSNISQEFIASNTKDSCIPIYDATFLDNRAKKKDNENTNGQIKETINSLQHNNSVENIEKSSSLDWSPIKMSDSTIVEETLKETEINDDRNTCNINVMDIIITHKEDENNLNDSFDNGLSIDEGLEEETEKGFPIKNNSLNLSTISTLLNSSLYNEVLSESVSDIVDNILNDESVNLPLHEKKPKRNRKRKSDALTDLQTCKRSQRIRAKQVILESSLNLNYTPIEIGKYTKIPKDSSWKELMQSEKIPQFSNNNSTIDCKYKATESNNLSISAMGFFQERPLEEYKLSVPQNHGTFNISQGKDFQSSLIRKEIKESSLDKSETPSIEQQVQIPTNNQQKEADTNTNAVEEINFNETHIQDFESPESPALAENQEIQFDPAFVIIPTERPPEYVPKQGNQTLLDILINSYSLASHKEAAQNLTKKERQQQNMILNEFEKLIMQYCYNEMELDSDCTAMRLINKLLSIFPKYKLIYTSIIHVSQKVESTQVPEKDLPSIIQEMPPRHLSKCMQRLFPILRGFLTKNYNFCIDLMEQIESVLFSSKQLEKLSLESTLNLTQLYLMACKLQETIGLQKNPARLFIAKCLYYYVQKSILMIHEVLMWYPTVLPYREDKTYDRSDALITVMLHILMNTKYDMDKTELRGRSLLSKLRYEYHFEPFKPKSEEVVSFLVEKLKNNKFQHLFLAFGLLCKRLGIQQTKNVVLLQHLLPLAQEYYCLAFKTNEFDSPLAILLELISIILKPFPSNTDVKSYHNEFSRFLNGIERPIIQEAALCSILRLQRFGADDCYNSLRHFQPNFELKTRTQAMLKSFLYRRNLTFWKSRRSENSLSF